MVGLMDYHCRTMKDETKSDDGCILWAKIAFYEGTERVALWRAFVPTIYC